MPGQRRRPSAPKTGTFLFRRTLQPLVVRIKRNRIAQTSYIQTFTMVFVCTVPHPVKRASGGYVYLCVYLLWVRALVVYVLFGLE